MCVRFLYRRLRSVVAATGLRHVALVRVSSIRIRA